MDFFLDHWGSIFSVIGVVVSAGGLSWAIFEARGAKSAAIETRDSIGRHLVATDLARAIGLIQRLKFLHREGYWEAALEQYQTLRAIISDIIPSLSDMGIKYLVKSLG